MSDCGDYCTRCWAEITSERGGSVSGAVEGERHFWARGRRRLEVILCEVYALVVTKGQKTEIL